MLSVGLTAFLSPLSVVLVASFGLWLCLRLLNLIRSRYESSRKRSHLSLPPGPKGLPLIGNLFDLPRGQYWLKTANWGEEYGDVACISALGQHVVYLNTYETACDLLDNRSAKYSDRAHTEMIKMIGADEYLAQTPDGEKWKARRRMFDQEFNAITAHRFVDTQVRHCGSMLHLIYHNPDAFEQHIDHFTFGAILETVYGIQIQTHDDPYLLCAERAISNLETLISGVYLVDLIPVLKYVPSWLPGAGFKRAAITFRDHLRELSSFSFRTAREKIVHSKDTIPNIITKWMERINTKTDKEERQRLEQHLKYVAGMALLGGYDTTSVTLLNFIFLMMAHPEIQEKLQEEIDAVVGRSRLPDLSDRKSLPYTNAVYKEVLRWHPIFPIGIPHRVMTEDEYKGMRIPSGSTVIPNVWIMTHDKTVYGSDADLFRPERFLEADLRDPDDIIFGFGRRICPGRHMAANSLFLAITSVSQLFKFDKTLDDEGMEIPAIPRWTTGIEVYLESFPCSITPRFEGVESLIKSIDPDNS